MVWVVSFRAKSVNATSGGYAALDFLHPPDVQSSLNASEAIIFWGGLHHNIKEVRLKLKHDEVLSLRYAVGF